MVFGTNALAVLFGKVSHQDAQYGRGHVPTLCSTCLHQLASSVDCRLVESPIEPGGWCKFWTARVKASGHGRRQDGN